MSATVLYMFVSLDGFIAGPNQGPGNGLGDGGHRLHQWSPTGADADRKAISGRLAGVNGRIVDESEMAQWPLVIYLNDVRTALSEAKRAARDKSLLVHGAGIGERTGETFDRFSEPRPPAGDEDVIEPYLDRAEETLDLTGQIADALEGSDLERLQALFCQVEQVNDEGSEIARGYGLEVRGSEQAG